jgi:TP901 family phage tail tape measure protein
VNIGDLIFSLLADGSRLEQDVTKQAAAAGDKGGTTLGNRLSSSVRKITAGAGAGIGIFVAGSVQEFAKFQESMNEVFTLLPDITQDAMDKMSAGVQAFSKETGKLPDEVIPALYQAISAGVPQDNVFDFLRTANQAAVAGVASTQDAVNLLAAVTKGYGDTSQEAVQKVADLAFQTVKLGQTTFPELAGAIGKVTPLAAALGVTQEELFGITATLTGVTGDTNEVMTQQRAILTALTKQTPAMAAALHSLGYETAQSAIESLGLKGTLDAVIGTTDGTTEAISGLITQSEAMPAVLALTASQSDVASEKIAAMGDAAGSVETAFERMDSGIGATARKIGANIRNFAIDVGRQLQDLGPLFVVFGPAAGRAIGAGLGAAFGYVAPIAAGLVKKALTSSVVVGAANAAGGIIGRTFAAAMTGAQVVGGVIAKALLRIPGVSAVVAAASTAGTALGSAMGGAMALAIPAAIVAAGLGIAAAFKSLVLDPDIEKQAHDIGERIGVQITSGTVDGLEMSRDALKQGIHDLEGVAGPLSGFLYGGQIDELKAQLDAVDAELASRAQEIPQTVAGPVKDGEAEVQAAAITMMMGIPDAIQKIKAFAAQKGAKIPGSVADGILAHQDEVDAAMTSLTDQMKNQLGRSKRIAQLIGYLTSDTLAEALTDHRGGVRDAADRSRTVWETELARLIGNGGHIGEKAGDALSKGLGNKNGTVRDQAQRTRQIVETAVDPNLTKVGHDAGDELAAGLGDKGSKLHGVAVSLGQLVAQGILQGVGGKDVATTQGGGKKRLVRAAGGPVYAGQEYIVGERRPELFRPEVNGRIIPNVPALRSASGSGRPSQTFNLTANGMPIRAATPFELVEQARRGARYGFRFPEGGSFRGG